MIELAKLYSISMSQYQYQQRYSSQTTSRIRPAEAKFPASFTANIPRLITVKAEFNSAIFHQNHAL